MDIHSARSFYRAFNRPSLSDDERARCTRAIEKFSENPFHPSLNYERLGGSSRQNQCSIRASQELRIILAVDPDFSSPESVLLLYAGHHDAAYRWASRRGYYTDAEGTVNLGNVAPPDTALANAISSLSDFEEWQLFLHPDQEPLVKRHYVGGEARIRGAAGTGKTVVALHRAVELGRRYAGEKVLFTTFSRSLTMHLKHLYRRMPNAPENVDFLNIDRVAYRLVKQWVDGQKVDAAFEAAYREIVPGTALERCRRDYVKDEIEKIIKGRAATREQYLDTGRFDRLGRRRRFTRADRELCWRLREAWDDEMRKDETTSFADVLIAARNRAWAREAGEYRAAIVDEAQDMTLVGMQLVRALVAGKRENRVPRDGLLILDDAAQRIYAGGFRLAWADLRVKGRSEILRTNYRNTRPIVEAAKAVRGDVLPVMEDNDDGAALHADFEQTEGSLPVFIRVAPGGEVCAIADEVRKLVDDGSMTHESIGVLMRSNVDADRAAKALFRKEVPCAMLKDMRHGTLGDGVRVGTFDRSKGLEFRAVLIPRLGASIFPHKEEDRYLQQTIPGLPTTVREPTDEEREARQLELDRLYVGMTRAKERLYMIADEAPCPEVENARRFFRRDRHRIGGPITSDP
ncbi:MAG: AAA family ATPase [Candidatus Aminicenantes bacterium]|nr:AAA family ATPase [Candidatus Aminicenantes bacterium]